MASSSEPDFIVKLAQSEQELRAAQHLRYLVFVQELGGDGDMVDHAAQLERDQFDPFNDHLILVDKSRPQDALNGVVGVYRLLQSDKAVEIGQFYSESEYDLSKLKASGRKLLELGRSCLHPEYRGGTAMFHIWQGLADYVAAHDIEILFGVASFHGIDLNELAGPLTLLHNRHLAPEDLRVRARPPHARSMDILSADQLDNRKAMLAVPALIKAYLRLGGFVGEGAYLDIPFNTTDVCLVMDTERMNARQKNIYTKREGEK